MKLIIVAIIAVFCSLVTWGQNGDATLFAQSPDGKQVHLLWSFRKAPTDTAGYYIAWKNNNSGWKPINRNNYVPGFINFQNSKQVKISKCVALLEKLGIDNFSQSKFLTAWTANDKGMKTIAYTASQSFECATCIGLAAKDTPATTTVISYGLFSASNKQLLATTTWAPGSTSKLESVNNISTRPLQGEQKGIIVTWNADLAKLSETHVSGFYVYKEGIRMNDWPVSNSNNTSNITEFSFIDSNASAEENINYGISAVTSLGIEGPIITYQHLPEEHPKKYESARVTRIESLGFYFKEGTSVQWSLPKEIEQFVKGFVVEKQNIPGVYKIVSGILPATTRSFIDSSGSNIDGYLAIRVTTIYKDRTSITGQPLLYSYLPMLEPVRPTNLTAKQTGDDRGGSIQIMWDEPMQGDSLTDKYRIYLGDEQSGSFSPLQTTLSKNKHIYTHSVPAGSSGIKFKFFVSSISKDGSESAPSDTIVVTLPKNLLKAPEFVAKAMPSRQVKVNWQYPKVTELEGFRVYINNELVADEKILKANSREYISLAQAAGTKCTVTIMAIGANGHNGLLAPLNIVEIQ